MENEIIYNDDSIGVIHNTLITIQHFQDLIKQKNSQLKEIEDIKKQLSTIINQLDNIKTYENHIDKINKEFGKDLEEKVEMLRIINGQKILKQKNQVITLIKYNLPDGMKLKESNINEDTWDIVFEAIEHKTLDDIVKNKKQDKVDIILEKEVGEISINVFEKYLSIRVLIKDETTPQEFIIEKPLRILPIVNHIIHRYYYKEGIEINFKLY